jgi:hypothetical protein
MQFSGFETFIKSSGIKPAVRERSGGRCHCERSEAICDQRPEIAAIPCGGLAMKLLKTMFGRTSPMWAAVILAVMVSGCAVSDNSASSNHITGASANGQPVLTEGENGTAAAEDSGEWGADDEFDLLEEELIEQTVVVADPLEPVNRVIYFVNDVLFV